MKRLLLLTLGCLVLVTMSTFSLKVARASGGGIIDLPGVAAISKNNVWAVGQFEDASATFQVLIEHWNGSTWQIVPSPAAGAGPSGLQGIAAVSKNDIWAVGSFFTSGIGGQTLIEHWNGYTWQIVPSPNVPGLTADNFLQGVAAVSKNDVWAVGGTSTSFGSVVNTLIEHWNGHTWSVVSSPSLGSLNFLNGVAAISKNDVWAVGYFFNIGSVDHGLIEHWDGHTWSTVTTSDLGLQNSDLMGVAATSAHDVWVVGGNDAGQALVGHWDGYSWQSITGPNNATLSSVAAISRNDGWAVGEAIEGGNFMTLIEHWNGHAWRIVPSPNDSAAVASFLTGVAAVPHDEDVWAVGAAGDASGEVTLIEAWNGSTWSIVSSPNP